MQSLTPLHSEKIWGYEDWIASTNKTLVQEDFVKLVKDYPLLVKVIQANDTLSVQVHPDDETAVKLEGSGANGKTECWYILDAQPDAKIIFGLKNKFNRSEFEKALSEKRLPELLNEVKVKKGDFLFIPSGMVHAICGGIRLLEVQQNCDITYRFYDWERGRELHVEKAFAAIHDFDEDAKTIKSFSDFKDGFSCKYFDLNKIEVKGGYSFFVRKHTNAQLVFVLGGSGTIRGTNADGTPCEKQPVKPEQIFAVLPGDKVTFEGQLELMRISLPNAEEVSESALF
ncbi:type I phosphomannose isomerase catalytic subunit [Treponema zioleckii]|uniref:type I phosphomannose isomerase catalytic subunit n=1 Tax=Treponema zioleckii TaxID=331680 RepID=UPI00168BEB23|nr:type I phosphomannose isomerase catalytic subunit [Treponema zioleckii]